MSASDAGSLCVRRPESIQSKGAPAALRAVGRRSRHGPSGPRRECGVRRREPVGRATGVYSIKRGPRCAARSGAAQPPRPFWAEPTSVGVRRREPVCQATGVYSIKRGPRCAPRSGEQRERAAGAVQERTRQGDNRGISAEMQCGTASRAARDLPARPVPRKTAGAPGMERPEFIPSGSPPHHARRGMEPCSPVNPFFLDGGFWLGESASRKPGGGVGGAFLLQEGQMASKPPTIFLWYRQAAPSLSKKEMVGPTVPHTECGFPVPRRARNPSSPAGESLVPRRARNCSLSAGEPHCQVIPESQSLRPLRGYLPLHMGGCPCSSRVFCRKSKRPAAGVS